MSSSLGQKFQLQGLVCLGVETNPRLCASQNAPKQNNLSGVKLTCLALLSALLLKIRGQNVPFLAPTERFCLYQMTQLFEHI